MVRIKQRYILGEIIFNDKNTVDCSQMTQKKVLDNFRRTVHELYGDIGLAKIQPNFYSKYCVRSNKIIGGMKNVIDRMSYPRFALCTSYAAIRTWITVPFVFLISSLFDPL